METFRYLFLFFGLLLLFVGLCLPAVSLTMESRLEQRSVLKFLCKSGDMPIACWRKLSDVFGAETMSKGRVRVWHRRFREGNENIKDRPKTGRPRSACSGRNCDAVRDFVQAHRNCTLQDVASEVNVSVTSAHRILKKDLKLSKISPKFVPKELTAEQKRIRQTMAQQNLDLMAVDPHVLDKIVTGDESWISIFEMPTKQNSSQWHPKGTHLARPQKPLPQCSEKKSMLTVFFQPERDHPGRVCTPRRDDRHGILLPNTSHIEGETAQEKASTLEQTQPAEPETFLVAS